MEDTHELVSSKSGRISVWIIYFKHKSLDKYTRVAIGQGGVEVKKGPG